MDPRTEENPKEPKGTKTPGKPLKNPENPWNGLKWDCREITGNSLIPWWFRWWTLQDSNL
jgi:hypothetical protein